MEISIGALGAGAEDRRSGGAARGAGAGYRGSRRGICPVERVTWGKVRGVGCDGEQRSPLAFRGAQRQDQAVAEAGGSGSWSHGLRSGEFADENEPPLVTVRTDHRLN